jgi:hypothetical protein
MAVTKVNADGWTFEVSDGAGGFIPIKGIEDFDVSRATTRADITDFDSEGSEENRVIRRGKTIALNGHFLEDESDGSRDPGQEAVNDLAEEVGTAAEETFRFTTPGGTIFEFAATVQEGTSGNKNDVGKFTYEITRSGATTNPAS